MIRVLFVYFLHFIVCSAIGKIPKGGNRFFDGKMSFITRLSYTFLRLCLLFLREKQGRGGQCVPNEVGIRHDAGFAASSLCPFVNLFAC